MKLRRPGLKDGRSSIARLFAWRKLRAAPVARQASRVFVVINTASVHKKFELIEAGAVETNELPEHGAVVIVFDSGRDEKDKRIVLPKPMGDRAAKDHVYEVVDDKARIIRSPVHSQLVYARDLHSLADFNQNVVIPGTLVIDHIISPTTATPTVVPIVLHGVGGEVQALLLYAVKRDKAEPATAVGQLQVTLKLQPNSSLEDLITAYAGKNGISLDGVDVEGPDNTALRTLSGSLPGYPLENDVFGLPVSKIYRFACISSAALAAASVGANVLFAAEAGYLSVASSQAIEARDEFSHQIAQTLTKEIRALASVVSVDEADAIAKAKSVWHPSALVAVECSTAKCTLELSTSVTRRASQTTADASGQLVSQSLEEELVRGVVAKAAPAGYVKRQVAITGDGNVVTVTFEQQKPDSSIRGLLPN